MLFALQYKRNTSLYVLRRRHGRWDTEKRKEHERRERHTFIYKRTRETRGGRKEVRTHCIRILCKRITSDYARLSANRITSLLFARRQAVDLVNSNSILFRADSISPTEQRFLERLFLNHMQFKFDKIKYLIQREFTTRVINFLNFSFFIIIK